MLGDFVDIHNYQKKRHFQALFAQKIKNKNSYQKTRGLFKKICKPELYKVAKFDDIGNVL